MPRTSHPPTLLFAIFKIMLWSLAIAVIVGSLATAYCCSLYFTKDRMAIVMVGVSLYYLGPAALLLLVLTLSLKLGWNMNRREFIALLFIGFSPLMIMVIFTLAVWMNMLIDPTSF